MPYDSRLLAHFQRILSHREVLLAVERSALHSVEFASRRRDATPRHANRSLDRTITSLGPLHCLEELLTFSGDSPKTSKFGQLEVLTPRSSPSDQRDELRTSRNRSEIKIHFSIFFFCTYIWTSRRNIHFTCVFAFRPLVSLCESVTLPRRDATVRRRTTYYIR